ncbi:DUF6233 domain-containing protein [Streptomyces monashensis]|uniref:Uncharacterized protein n=1 Tax=Streptomyces monashensis TaxID=1678012 RepID=A0A1S2PRB2_9ACTN|nr:DUF6233 domain-containing protein [Streptomyces monashensis]OIJ96329.1 hypothetical protein BIV23_32805 [Streptomyces monashensis]
MKGSRSLPGFSPARTKTGHVVQQERTPHGPEPAFLHLPDCAMIECTTHRIRPDEAQAALTDSNIAPCPHCRPDSELGILN